MQFNYVVRTKEGEMQSGIVEAADRQRAVITLQSKNLIVLNLQSSGEKAFFSRDFAIFQSVKSKDLVSFSRQLSILFSAQVPLLSALRALVKQTDNAYFRDIIFEVANDVEGGTVFSKALSRHPKVFSSFFVNMVKSGEASGSLEGSLNYLADYLEKQFYLISRVRGAMIYPAFILFGFVVAAILMMVLVVPKLTGFLEETGQGGFRFLDSLVVFAGRGGRGRRVLSGLFSQNFGFGQKKMGRTQIKFAGFRKNSAKSLFDPFRG
ncbi:MAG: Type II secretion system F domain protein [Parcubacteria group bacterium GW2011_GWB1_42_6]|nr:MAG: Type II secretion system F domain protein [Parcubacteria group bacterium GW2011_GWB1_42_6]